MEGVCVMDLGRISVDFGGGGELCDRGEHKNGRLACLVFICQSWCGSEIGGVSVYEP